MRCYKEWNVVYSIYMSLNLPTPPGIQFISLWISLLSFYHMLGNKIRLYLNDSNKMKDRWKIVIYYCWNLYDIPLNTTSSLWENMRSLCSGKSNINTIHHKMIFNLFVVKWSIYDNLPFYKGQPTCIIRPSLSIQTSIITKFICLQILSSYVAKISKMGGLIIDGTL